MFYSLEGNKFLVENKMINLVDLYYQINKGIFFTDKISNEAFSIYYNQALPEVMWNYAAISNLSTLEKNYGEICHIFEGLHKKNGFYLREDQKNDICHLIEHQIMIKYPESWLRFETNEFITDIISKKVQTPEEQKHFIELFSNFNQKYYQNLDAFIKVFQKTFTAENFTHYLIYHQKQAVGTAILSTYKTYALISNLQIIPEYSEPKYYNSLLKICTETFKQKQGKELYLQIIDNPKLEKIVLKQGFKKMFNAYLLD